MWGYWDSHSDHCDGQGFSLLPKRLAWLTTTLSPHQGFLDTYPCSSASDCLQKAKWYFHLPQFGKLPEAAFQQFQTQIRIPGLMFSRAPGVLLSGLDPEIRPLTYLVLLFWKHQGLHWGRQEQTRTVGNFAFTVNAVHGSDEDKIQNHKLKYLFTMRLHWWMQSTTPHIGNKILSILDRIGSIVIHGDLCAKIHVALGNTPATEYACAVYILALTSCLCKINQIRKETDWDSEQGTMESTCSNIRVKNTDLLRHQHVQKGHASGRIFARIFLENWDIYLRGRSSSCLYICVAVVPVIPSFSSLCMVAFLHHPLARECQHDRQMVED